MSGPVTPPGERICVHCGDYVLGVESFIWTKDGFAHVNSPLCWAIFQYVRHGPYDQAEEKAELHRLREKYIAYEALIEDRYHWWRESHRDANWWPKDELEADLYYPQREVRGE